MQNSQRIELQCKQFSYSLKSILINTDNTTGSLKDLYNLIASPTGERKARLGQVQKIGFAIGEGTDEKTAHEALYKGTLSKSDKKDLKHGKKDPKIGKRFGGYDSLKQDLGFYVPSGIIKHGHKASDLTNFNGFIGLDIDLQYQGGHEKAKATKTALSKFDFIPFLHLSSGANGVKGLILTDLKECDKDLYDFAQRQIFAHLSERGIDLGKDKHAYGKTCYFADDKDAYLSETATPFHIDLEAYEAEKQAKQRAEQLAQLARKSVMSESDSLDEATKAVKHLIDNNISVASSYDERFKFLAACIEVFGEMGSDIAFDVLICSDGFNDSSFKYRFSEIAKSIEKSNYTGKKAGLGTILKFANGSGFQYVRPISASADNSIEAFEGEKLTDVLKRLNITPEQLANKKLIAPTGLGKGFLVNWIANTTDESVILVCPNTLLVMQFAERYGFTPFYANTDPKLLKGAKKIAVTYHSFERLSNLINVPEYRTFLDEWQNNTSGASQGYLLKPLHSVINCLKTKAFKSVTLLTGTDIFNFHPYFEQFKTIEVKATRTEINYTITDCTDILATAAKKAVKSVKYKRTPVIFLNNKGLKLTALKAMLGNMKIAVINADEKGSADFENIVKNGRIADDVECLICTSSLKEGNDILNNRYFDFIVCDAKIGSIELRQLVGRARNAKGVTLHILKAEKREKSKFAYNIGKRRAKLEIQAQDECDELNTGNYDFNTNLLAEKIRKGIQSIAIRINDNNVFEVDYLLLSYMIYAEMVFCEYSNDNYQQTNLERLGFKLEGNEMDATETDASIKDELKAAKQAQKEVFETEYSEYIETLKTVDDIQHHIESSKTTSKAEKVIIERIEHLQNEFPLSPAECVEMIADITSKNAYKLLVDRMRVSDYLTDKTDDTKLSMFYKSLKSKFEVGQYYTPNEIREKVLESVKLLKTVDMAKFDKDKERNTNILKELRKVFEVTPISRRTDTGYEKIFRIESVTLVCTNNLNKTKVTDFENVLLYRNEVFVDAPF